MPYLLRYTLSLRATQLASLPTPCTSTQKRRFVRQQPSLVASQGGSVRRGHRRVDCRRTTERLLPRHSSD